MEIPLGGNFYMRSDKLNFILAEKKIKQQGDEAGTEYLKDIAYFGSIDQLLKYALNKRIRLSEADTLTKLNVDIQEAISDIEGALLLL